MKRIAIIFTMLLLIGAMALTSCDRKASAADKNLQNAVAGLAFPQKLNDGSSLTDLTYQDKVLTFTIEVSKAKFKGIDNTETRAETLNNLRTGLFPRNLVDNVVAAGAQIKYIYVNKSDKGKTMEFTYDAEELK